MEFATLGAGCFWCVEAVFLSLKGVKQVQPGYSGGHVENPSYEAVCAGSTGHAEVCHIEFDPTEISYTKILEAFFQVHDPTSLNKQGEDIGTQYRSVIFFHTKEQESIATDLISALNASNAYSKKLVTLVEPFERFYAAEEYHKNYFEQNPNQQYCSRVVKPKVEKFKKVFATYLK